MVVLINSACKTVRVCTQALAGSLLGLYCPPNQAKPTFRSMQTRQNVVERNRPAAAVSISISPTGKNCPFQFSFPLPLLLRRWQQSETFVFDGQGRKGEGKQRKAIEFTAACQLSSSPSSACTICLSVWKVGGNGSRISWLLLATAPYHIYLHVSR